MTETIDVIPSRETDQKRLTALINSHLEQVQPSIVIGEVKQMSYGPPDLLSSIWLQFALAHVSGLALRQCKNCGKPFEISGAGYNKNREFCSANCRTKDLRLRKKMVLDLASSKNPPSDREIAEQTGTKIQAVKDWKKAEKATREAKRRR